MTSGDLKLEPIRENNLLNAASAQTSAGLISDYKVYPTHRSVILTKLAFLTALNDGQISTKISWAAANPPRALKN
jgi:hypothetical protein